MKTTSAKFILTEQPVRGERAWYCNFGVEIGAHYIPYSMIGQYTPATREISINTFILKQKGIKFKL